LAAKGRKQLVVNEEERYARADSNGRPFAPEGKSRVEELHRRGHDHRCVPIFGSELHAALWRVDSNHRPPGPEPVTALMLGEIDYAMWSFGAFTITKLWALAAKIPKSR